ncbi:MAG: NADH:flavin oxidoreductase/NADH oxidase [Gammaproteobacteria bacterium]|nr:MAG: NADH:flavin oxidoreductase/NADH oxidase [Gammaproteobacteria bacterium]
MSSKLFTPIELRGLRLDNRIVVSPMCQYSADNGNAGDWHLMHLGQFSVSGAGLLMVEMTNVEARGRISPCCLGLYDDDNERALARVVAFCRRYGDIKIGVQLAHAGRKASTLPPWQGREPLLPGGNGWQTVSASAIASSDRSPPPTALTGDEIARLIDAFAAATRRAHRIGFDAIELHGAHGYLLHQFLSPLSNQREDDYGGSLDNRMRFPLAVFDAVRGAWPDDKPVGIRVSAIDWVAGGWSMEDTLAFGRELTKRGCDWIDVSSGGLVAGENITVGPGYQVPFAEQVRKHTGLTTMAVGMITEPRQAEAIISSGRADMVALARGMLYDPRWAWHAAAELGAEVAYPNQYQRCRPAGRSS